MERSKTTMTRIWLSVRLGVVGGIIWGLLFTAYYSMLPYFTVDQSKRFTFAWQSATACFIILTITILSIPYIYKAMKEAKD